jgi:hypothetical protein
MDAPRLEACYFPNPDPKKAKVYERLAAVLDYTARKHLPDWSVNVELIKPPKCKSSMGNPSHEWNTQKLEFWNQQVQEAPDGARLLLIDGDTYLRRPLDEAWDIQFDLAYTIRQGHGTRLPLNGGVVFVRVSPGVRAFMAKWWEMNVDFLSNSIVHRRWRIKYAGINQASFGYMLEVAKMPISIKKLACAEWNLCEWDAFRAETTRVVHVKSGLRRHVFDLRPATFARPVMRDLSKEWHALEAEMVAAQKEGAA